MIEQSKYLPKQMNGPVINSIMKAMEDELSDTKTIEDYLYGLSIATAQETELENIGRIVGYPRPLVPVGFEAENVFIFTALQEQDSTIGFSTVDSEVGGRFSSLQKSKTNYMNLGLYRKFLDKIAYIKRYGITIYCIDQIARLVDDEYEILTDEWDATGDITVYFPHYIGFMNVWILSELFLRVSTIPFVQVISFPED